MFRLVLAVIGWICLAQPAFGQMCSDEEKECKKGTYLHDAGPLGPKDRCDGKTCRDDSLAPNKAYAVCTYTAPWFDCKIWPRGPGFIYYWDNPNGVVMGTYGATPFPFQSFLCNRPNGLAEAQATVSAPSGVSSTVGIKIYCAQGDPSATSK